MTAKLPTFALIWLTFSSFIVVWDFLFVLNRPATFENPIWTPYRLYITVDKTYGDMESNWVVAQSIMNIPETVLNFLAVIMHFMGAKGAILVAFSSLLMTFWKTVAYFLIELVSGHANTGHNGLFNYWITFFLPNSMWIIVPGILLVVLGTIILNNLNKVVKSKKKTQ